MPAPASFQDPEGARSRGPYTQPSRTHRLRLDSSPAGRDHRRRHHHRRDPFRLFRRPHGGGLRPGICARALLRLNSRRKPEQKLTIPFPGTSIALVNSIKQVLIITDGSPALGKAVSAIQEKLGDIRTVVKKAADFVPVDILPADAYFFGCETPHPASFLELERVLKGINLAGRPCGLFTLASNEAIEYLRAIVRDADLRLHPAPLILSGSSDVGRWAAETLR